MKEFYQVFKSSHLKTKPQIIKKIGLLLRLQNAYIPSYSGVFHSKIFDKKSYEKWLTWKKDEFSAKQLLDSSGFTISEVKDWRDWLAAQGIMKDPLHSWYMLVRLTPYDKRQTLRGKALLAQDYYEMVGMLNYFLDDLTDEKQMEPDDIMDGGRGSWKDEIYGKKFDYNDSEIRRKIVDEYVKLHIPKVTALVEGETEEISIPIIANAMGIYFEIEDIIIHDFEGTGGIQGGNITGVLNAVKLGGAKSYVIIDNDENAEYFVKQLLGTNLLEENCYRIWTHDFEEDNFGQEDILKVVNEIATEKGLPTIQKSELEKDRKQKKIVKALHDLYRKKYGLSLSAFISKPELGRILSLKRANEIRKEIESGTYSPKIEIEKEIIKILKLTE